MSTETKHTASRRERAVTAGLSAVGASAGALGLAVGAKAIRRHGWRGTPRLTRALIPVEAAGLGGELMATKILRQDVKNEPKKPKEPVVKSLGTAQSNGIGHRIVDEPVAKARRFDPEADRQRRLGTYAGLAAGGGILTGDQFRREVHVGDMKTKAHAPKIKGIGLKRVGRGAGFGAATLGLAAVAAGSVKRGVSERNQTWS